MRHLRILIAALFGALICLPSPAFGAGVTQVSGLLTPDTAGVCTELPNAFGPPAVVSGSLVGCWYIDTADKMRSNPGGGFYASGTETFSGCLGSACGHLFTTFTFTAKFDETGAEVHG